MIGSPSDLTPQEIFGKKISPVSLLDEGK